MAVDQIIQDCIHEVIDEHGQSDELANLIKLYLNDSIDQTMNNDTKQERAHRILDMVIE